MKTSSTKTFPNNEHLFDQDPRHFPTMTLSHAMSLAISFSVMAARTTVDVAMLTLGDEDALMACPSIVSHSDLFSLSY
jgi:hypothetical protein